MSDDDFKSRFTQGNTARTVLQLVIASIVVGAIFSFMGIGPREFWRGAFDTVHNILSSLGENVTEIVITLGTYLLIGAAIIIPIWLVTRLLSSRK